MTKNKTADNTPTTFPAKFLKTLQTMPEFKDSADAASTDELKQMIVLAEGNIYEIDIAKSGDEKLNAAKAVAKDILAPFADALKCQRTKIAYALFLLDGRGEQIGSSEED